MAKVPRPADILWGMSDVTQILSKIEAGDCHASAELLPLVYEELRRLAAVRMANENASHTLQATALVHEAYLRLVDVDQPDSWQGRGHFFASAAEAMRRILIERARRKQRVRHGGGHQRIDLDEGVIPLGDRDPDQRLLELNEALERLERVEASRAEIVKLRYFAGLTVPQAAQAMGISVSTAERYWRFARAWLLSEVSNGPSDSEKP